MHIFGELLVPLAAENKAPHSLLFYVFRERGSVELEGKSHKKKKKTSLFTDDEDCEDGDYSKRTLKRAYDLPFAALFKDTRGEKKFEASDIIMVRTICKVVSKGGSLCLSHIIFLCPTKTGEQHCICRL